MGGGAVFEIILTAVLAALTGGVGAVAATASKARHITKFKKLGELFVDFAKATKRAAAYAKDRAKRAAKTRDYGDLKTDMPAVDRKGDKPAASDSPVAPKTNPKDVRKAADQWPAAKQEKFAVADKFYSDVGYENYDSHLRGIDFDQPVEVIDVPKGSKLYQYSYLDRQTGLPKVGSYFYDSKAVDPSELGF